MSIVLTGIFVYPVKALRGVSVRHAEVRPAGLADDRRWVIVGPDGRFLSQRSHPALARISAEPRGSGVVLAAAGHPDFRLAPPVGHGRRSVDIWRDQVSAAAAEPAADAWLTRVLGTPCHLAWMDADCRRPLRSPVVGPAAAVSFADGYPCLISSEESLADLNRRLDEPLPMNRFRPNLVVAGAEAFAEDTWSRLTIGQATFINAGPCVRCAVTTVDQITGQNRGPEPLRALAAYRQVENGVIFGVNLAVERPGPVQIGDLVQLAP